MRTMPSNSERMNRRTQIAQSPLSRKPNEADFPDIRTLFNAPDLDTSNKAAFQFKTLRVNLGGSKILKLISTKTEDLLNDLY